MLGDKAKRKEIGGCLVDHPTYSFAHFPFSFFYFVNILHDFEYENLWRRRRGGRLHPMTPQGIVSPLVLLSLKLEHDIMSIGITCVCYT
jgi:hypothetical protein